VRRPVGARGAQDGRLRVGRLRVGAIVEAGDCTWSLGCDDDQPGERPGAVRAHRLRWQVPGRRPARRSLVPLLDAVQRKQRLGPGVPSRTPGLMSSGPGYGPGPKTWASQKEMPYGVARVTPRMRT